MAAKSWENKKKASVYKTFKSNIEGLEDAMCESRAVNHAAQFMKMLQEIEKFVQMKFSINVA